MDLPRVWITAGSNPLLWGRATTYKRIRYEALPPLCDGAFARIASAPVEHGMCLAASPDARIEDSIAARAAEAARAGLTLPASFATFLRTPELHARIPSCTACYFELGARLVPVPGEPGPARLLRFMNDQQTCFLWYLLLEPGGRHAVVVASPDWKEVAEANTLDDAIEPDDLAICAASFDVFIDRWWIENTIWFAAQRGVALEGELLAYARAAQQAVAAGIADVA